MLKNYDSLAASVEKRKKTKSQESTIEKVLFTLPSVVDQIFGWTAAANLLAVVQIVRAQKGRTQPLLNHVVLFRRGGTYVAT